MARNLDLAALRSFTAVAETGGVTRAAQRLHLTQSAVSMQIKRLEQALGTELLSREGRGVSLTRRGEELLTQARRLISLNDAIWEQMTAPDCSGEISLGLPHDIIYPLAPAVLRAFNRDHPAVKVVLVSAPSKVLRERLDAGEVDLVVTTEYGLGEFGETLAERELIWVGAPGGRAWRRRPVPIAFERRCAFLPRTLETLERAGLEWETTLDTDYCDAAIAAIAADLSICSLLEGTLPPALAPIDHGGELPRLPSLNINMYAQRGSDAELAERLASYIRVEFASRAAVAANGPAGAHDASLRVA